MVVDDAKPLWSMYVSDQLSLYICVWRLTMVIFLFLWIILRSRWEIMWYVYVDEHIFPVFNNFHILDGIPRLNIFLYFSEPAQNAVKYLTWHRTTSSRSSSSRNLIQPNSNGNAEDASYNLFDNFCMVSGSHASTLDRLYAWERKLYDEVKVRLNSEIWAVLYGKLHASMC